MNLVHRLGIISFPSAVLSLSLLLHLAAVTAKYAAAGADMQRVPEADQSRDEVSVPTQIAIEFKFLATTHQLSCCRRLFKLPSRGSQEP
jgi:hypothetical protein